MNIPHVTTDPNLLTRVKETLSSATRADIAVGYFFISDFSAVPGGFKNLKKPRPW